MPKATPETSISDTAWRIRRGFQSKPNAKLFDKQTYHLSVDYLDQFYVSTIFRLTQMPLRTQVILEQINNRKELESILTNKTELSRTENNN